MFVLSDLPPPGKQLYGCRDQAILVDVCVNGQNISAASFRLERRFTPEKGERILRNHMANSAKQSITHSQGEDK